jgi:protein O-mannosyl-transferase
MRSKDGQKRSLAGNVGKGKPESKKTAPSPGIKPPGSSGINTLVPLLVILVITFIAFLPALRNGFVLWDDPEYTFENPLLKNFSHSKIFSFSTFYMGNYHPLTLLWLHWEVLLFPKGDPALYHGLDPFWFHLNNLLLHVLNTALVFYLVHELFGKKSWKIAAVVALLFGVHPMHVESVAWVSEIKDVLYGAFFLGALLAYTRFVKTRNLSLLLLAFLLFVLSNLAKGQAVTLPLLLLLIDYFLDRKFTRNVLLEKIPFFAVSLLFGILALKAQAAESAINATYYSSFSSIFYGCYGFLVYIFKFFLPIHLSGAHPYPTSPNEPLPAYFYLMPFMIAAIGFLLYRTIRHTKAYLFGFLFFLFSISVMLKIVPVGDTITAERYTYIPYIGLFIIFGMVFNFISAKKKWTLAANISVIVIFLILGVMTWQRTQVWKDSFSFWGDVCNKYQNYWRGYNCLAQEYAKIGNYDKALECYTLACEKDKWAPPTPYMMRGAIYVDHLKNYDLAVADFLKVLSFPDKNDPTQIDGRHNLALAYNKKGDFAKAISVLDEVSRMVPDNPLTYYFKGISYTGLKNYTQAETEYSHAIALNPNYVAAYFNRGILYTDYMNRFDKGIADFQKVLEVNPDNQDAIINTGICYYKMNRWNDAIQKYSDAIRSFPKEGRTYYLRAITYAQAGNFSQAYQDGLMSKQAGFGIPDQLLNEWRSKSK